MLSPKEVKPQRFWYLPVLFPPQRKKQKFIPVPFLRAFPQITKKQCCWSGALRLGFTSKDPSRINPDTLPKYACPDLVSQSGFWAKALPEQLSNEGNVVSFWVDKRGRVFYRINDSTPMLFFSGVLVSEPLWALIDIYGLTRGVQLLGESQRSQGAPADSYARAQSQSDFWSRLFLFL